MLLVGLSLPQSDDKSEINLFADLISSFKMKQRDTSSSTVSIDDEDNEMLGDAVDEDTLGRDSPAFITVENEV